VVKRSVSLALILPHKRGYYNIYAAGSELMALIFDMCPSFLGLKSPMPLNEAPEPREREEEEEA